MSKVDKPEDINLITNKSTGKQDNPQETLQSTKMVEFKELFRYATKSDKILVTIGLISAAVNGLAMPLFSVMMGGQIDSFSSNNSDDMVSGAGESAIKFIVLGVITFILSFLMFSTFMISGERQCIEMKRKYFESFLKQEIGWYDSINPNELNTKVADETNAVQEAIQEKIGTFVMTMSTFICGFIVGYIYGWQLALVVTAAMPCLALSIIIIVAVSMKSAKETTECYSSAAAESEQALNGIRTVKMLDGEDHECEKYDKMLKKAAEVTVKYNFVLGLCMGLIYAFMIWTYALGFFYGAKLISDQTINTNTGDIYTAGDVMTVFFSILMSSFSLGQAGPCFQSFAKGKIAGAQMFFIIDRVPKLLPSQNPKSLQNFDGQIIIEDVDFYYPAKPDVPVLNQCNLVIPKGKKVALVGESGCGKSTILQLVERFYDVNDGRILLGSEKIDIRDVDLREYRSKVGLVGQEPALFATSVKENLRYGKQDATDEEIIDALKKVNAWDFVQKMDHGLDTYVGMGGSQISGGQKQRIAIARAILKKPIVLLLDEATSALDRTNEKLIQETLDEVSQGITTIVIAHRLSTIQNADLIYVFAGGKVIEQGTHQELMNLHGKYEQLAKNQVTSDQKEEQVHQQKQTNKIERKQSNFEQAEQIVESQVKIGSMMNIGYINNANPEAIKEVVQDLKDLNIEIKKKEISDHLIMPRLFSYSKEERVHLIIGLISSAIDGAIFPCFSLFMSEMVTLLVKSNPDLYSTEEQRRRQLDKTNDDSQRLCLWFFLIGIAFLIFQACENYFLSVVAENLARKLRNMTFRKLLRMPISYFDKQENNAGTLTARLSVDCKTVQSLTSTVIGFKIQNAAALITGISISFSASWAVTLIVLATTPIKWIGEKMKSKYFGGAKSSHGETAFKEAGNLIMESVTNIRTVYSFGNEDVILNTYSKKINEPLAESRKQSYVSGLSFGFAQLSQFLINALVFYTGALLVKYDGLEIGDMFKAMFGISYATMGASRDAHFDGDVVKGKTAAKNIFQVLDSQDEFQYEEENKFQRLKQPIKGQIEAKNITFRYPNRDKNVFTNLNLTIHQEKKIAFVGSSGCGKSTIMQMLMRFYDPDSGVILVDGIDIRDYDIRYLRKQIAIVSQEPVLFNGTIKDNIQYNMKNSTMEQIEEAAKKANAYDFIMNNQFDDVEQDQQQQQNQQQIQLQIKSGKGFSKNVGTKGSQISGGQKQRIAIARAVLRESNILLLDEATSALDSKSEDIVTESLNRIMQGKTTLSIAHRISTIKDCDMIYVFDNGMIVEQGNYAHLVGLKNFFYRMEKGIAIGSTQHS